MINIGIWQIIYLIVTGIGMIGIMQKEHASERIVYTISVVCVLFILYMGGFFTVSSV